MTKGLVEFGDTVFHKELGYGTVKYLGAGSVGVVFDGSRDEELHFVVPDAFRAGKLCVVLGDGLRRYSRRST